MIKTPVKFARTKFIPQVDLAQNWGRANVHLATKYFL